MSAVPRLVIDTSTLIGAVLRPNSVPRQAFLAAVKSYELCVSSATLNELRDVLQRDKFDNYLPLQERMEFLALLIERCLHWDVDAASEQAVSGACRDPKDDKFLALALACQAVTVVSSDDDLLVLHPWQGLPILTPAAFIARMGRVID